MKHALATFVLACWAGLATAADVTVAVASNFVTTAFKLVAEFEGETGFSVAVGHGATGHLYTQIVRGAPFDVLLAGDDARPAMLLANGRATETRAYAVGRLALVSREPLTRKTAAEALEGRTVALADPIAAPYGKASTRAMERLKLDTASFRTLLVINVGQVATLFDTGNADAAFVAASQVPFLDAPEVFELEQLIPGIPQHAAFLSRAVGNEAARAFWDWLATESAQDVIAASGYELPTR
ncbi:MAG: molybdate ABC transporter substrate-binding protein [Boseongicola sp. SB0677_bin_26]|nr:molybdate ABC transporter substrate-binding protein [Boseongicola sp. SB0665_bin_10]MYG28074.1 molybdate ABC transporter substrate-binding protein [Boseongicola sp. SB0677_bin_26]